MSSAVRLEPGNPVTIGVPLRGWEFAVVDADDRLVPLGEPGELVISGAGLGRYLRPELDEQRYRPLPAMGWDRAYRSGDIVRDTVNGLEFIGRRDHQVKIGGRRIELGEVDGVLSSVPGIRGACTVVRESAAGKFTFAELEENDEDLKKLASWLEKIRKLDFHGASLAAQASERLAQCEALLDAFAQRVFEAQDENRPAAGKPS